MNNLTVGQLNPALEAYGEQQQHAQEVVDGGGESQLGPHQPGKQTEQKKENDWIQRHKMPPVDARVRCQRQRPYLGWAKSNKAFSSEIIEYNW